jgi:SAM-dependent methyltransferase
VLDLGAGAGKNPYSLRGRVRRIIGVDVDPRVETNPLLDKGVVADAGRLPFDDNSFDVVFSIYVLEHVGRPADLVREIRRVLRPGGVFLALTPNRYHYVPVIASVTPTSFHKWLNKRRGREVEDTFPTAYRLNTRHALLKHFSSGFECVKLEMFEVAPNYLRFSLATYLVGVAYERLVNGFDLLAPLRVNILSVFRKLPD